MALEMKHKELNFAHLIQGSELRHIPMRFLNTIIKEMFKRNGFYEFGYEKKYFNFAKKPKSIRNHKIQIFKGFKTTFEVREAGLRLLMDT